MRNFLFLSIIVLSLTATPVMAGPDYKPDRRDLEKVMEDLITWLPGAWDSYPQVYSERIHGAPEEGEHEHWHRVFERIDAPQIGDVVFYGQIQTEGRDGPLLTRSQVIYKAWIDEERGAVVVNGQPPADEDRFVDLQDKPELWGDVQFRDESAINCDFLWYRDGAQIFGVLEGKTPEKQKYGWGTCNYYAAHAEAEFMADAEWVLGPEHLWIYDINTMDGMLFIGREDKTHTRLFRAKPYVCNVTDATGARSLNAHDRGFKADVTNTSGDSLTLLLLRGEFPAADGFGLDDRLRLILHGENEVDSVVSQDSSPLTDIAFDAEGITASCAVQDSFPPVTEADG